MADHVCVVIFICSCVVLVLTDSTDNCQKVEVGIAHKLFMFPFKWSAQELESVTCDKYGTTIGHCRGISVFDCSVEQSFRGLYNMSSNANLTQVILTIITFDETLAGEYCCSKESKKESTCQCVQKAEPLTPKPAPSAEAPTAPEGTQTQASSTGIQIDTQTNSTSTGKQLGLNDWALTTCVPIFFHLSRMYIAD